MDFNPLEWHSKVKTIFSENQYYKDWARTAPYKGRLIPLCTPIPASTDILVIGMNHAEFDTDDPTRGNAIAEEYSLSVPTVSTLVAHDHKYAHGLRRVTRKSGLMIDTRWVGTNRCPIQTGSSMRDLQKCGWFDELLPKMDKLIKELIEGTRPKYVIACGTFAAEIFYKKGMRMSEMEPRYFGQGGPKYFPIKHPSRGSFDEFSVKRLRELRRELESG